MTQMVASRDRQATLKDLLERAAPSIRQALPKHLDVTRLLKIALTATSRTPALLECTPQSILMAVMQAAQLGLEPGSVLGSAYLVPYGKECQLIVGYRGLVDLARRSGKISSVEAHVVHEHDRFVCSFGLTPRLEHEPTLDEPGKIIAVYAIATMHDGAKQVELMSFAQVTAIRERSRAKNSGPWVTDTEEMARKTVVRRLAKYLPLSPELAAAFELDDRADTGEVHAYSDMLDVQIEPDEPPTQPSAASRAKVAERAAAAREAEAAERALEGK